MTTLERVGDQAPHNFFRPLGDPDGRHSGEDTGHASGDSIYAAADGVVTYVYTGSGYNGGWGRRIVIEHAPGVSTTYNHMDAGGVFVTFGQKVKAGQRIARQGSSGKVNGKHLHFEVYHDGIRINPRPFFEGRHLPGTAPAPGTPAGKPTIGAAQRVVRHPVRRRKSPTSSSANVTTRKPLLSAGTVGNFTGYIRGEKVTLNGITTNIWFRGISGDYFWAGNFTTQSTKGLKNLGTWKAPTKSTSKPKLVKKRYVRLAEPWFHFPTEAAARGAQRGHHGPTLAAGDYLITDQKSDRQGPFRVWVDSSKKRAVWVGTGRTNPKVVSK